MCTFFWLLSFCVPFPLPSSTSTVRTACTAALGAPESMVLLSLWYRMAIHTFYTEASISGFAVALAPVSGLGIAFFAQTGARQCNTYVVEEDGDSHEYVFQAPLKIRRERKNVS